MREIQEIATRPKVFLSQGKRTKSGQVAAVEKGVSSLGATSYDEAFPLLLSQASEAL